ncbi:MAG: multidrug efflux SMR transporter [Burkholderiaceae bacterium]
MHWFYLAAAIGFEVVGTTCMKLSAGFTKIVPVVVMFSCFAVAFFFNSLALRVLDLSITYAIWSGVGTAATAVIGIMFFKEALTALKLVSILLIILGVIGLRFSFTPN